MNKFESYDYLKVTVEETRLSHYIDGYECFGWKLDPNIPLEVNGAKAVVHFKRSRAILNKVELTRLQSHFEACQRDLEALEGSAVSLATSAGIGAGILGCAFVAGAVFAVTAETPIIWLMILLAIPGFILWGAAYPIYKYVKMKRMEKVEPLMEAKIDESEEVCKKGHALL